MPEKLAQDQQTHDGFYAGADLHSNGAPVIEAQGEFGAETPYTIALEMKHTSYVDSEQDCVLSRLKKGWVSDQSEKPAPTAFGTTSPPAEEMAISRLVRVSLRVVCRRMSENV